MSPLRKTFTPLLKTFISLCKTFTPLRKTFTPLCKTFTPLRKTFTPLCKTSTSSDTSINLQLVTEVRRRIFDEQNIAGWKDNYDQRDVERLKQDNWYCARFIKHQKEAIEDSLNMIRDTMKWRKEMGINDDESLAKVGSCSNLNPQISESVISVGKAQNSVHGEVCILDYAIIQSNGKQSEKKEIECYMGQPLSPDIVQVPPGHCPESIQKNEDFDTLFLSPESAIPSYSQPEKSSKSNLFFTSFVSQLASVRISLSIEFAVGNQNSSPATLVFPESIDSEPAPVCLTLTNITSNCVAYELKTNNLGIYHVKPPWGIIEPGGFQNVHIKLTKGLHCGPTDIIILVAVEVEEKEPKIAQVNSIWEKSSPQNILKHKFKCVNFGFMSEDTVDRLIQDKMKAIHEEGQAHSHYNS
ncbi:uncharacterized protein LOC143251280 [Tachypleus tridentatus]|uniref:uncharacterized protein LOC143251280 n=1 Tax=Tachypleus tridentatus TaxID=6853 RepID=UPI003FCFFD67